MLFLIALAHARDTGAVPTNTQLALESFVRSDVSAVATVTPTTTCEPTWGTCSACSTFTATSPTAGTVDVYTTGTADGSAQTGCSDTFAYGARSVTYTLARADLSADYTYAPRSNTFTLAFDGDRLANVALASARGTVSYTSTATVTGDAVIVDDTVGAYQLEVRYSAFAGHAWSGSVTGDGAVFTGTLTRDDGASCTVSGVVGDGVVQAVDVSCSGA
jgi:hypothetical protein